MSLFQNRQQTCPVDQNLFEEMYAHSRGAPIVGSHGVEHGTDFLVSASSGSSVINLSGLNSQALHMATLQAAKNEKSATLILLDYLAEVDRRRLYAEWGYSSLFEYVHKALGYSEAQSSERVTAMRLLRKVPEVKLALEKGSLTLTSTAKLGSHVRREKASVKETLDLLRQCEGKPTREVERVLVQNCTQMAPLPERVKAITPTLTQLILEVDEEFMALVTRMRELDGNPAFTLQEVFQKAMREFIKRREVNVKAVKESKAPKVKAEKSQVNTSPLRNASRAPEVLEGVVTPRSRYIRAALRKRIRIRSGDQCEYRDRHTNRRCESRSRLEFDHVIPFGKGGENTEENLRHVCRAHNLFYALKSYGKKKMRPYLRGE